jgi:hypothetical protein
MILATIGIGLWIGENPIFDVHPIMTPSTLRSTEDALSAVRLVFAC